MKTEASQTSSFISSPSDPMPGNKFVGVRLPDDMVEAAKIAAASEHRTLSNYILTLIDKDLRERTTGTGQVIQDSSPAYGQATAQSPPTPGKRKRAAS